MREHVERVVQSQAAQLESDFAQAVMLQDYDHLDQLAVVTWVTFGAPPPAVVSLLLG